LLPLREIDQMANKTRKKVATPYEYFEEFHFKMARFYIIVIEAEIMVLQQTLNFYGFFCIF
jgi:hypothetical protein